MSTPNPLPLVWPFTACSREEIDIDLQVFEGEIPSDIYGHVYINSPCGSVNGPTPAPQYWPNGEPCGEWSDMLFNGDGMVFRFDLNPGQVHVKSGLLRTPCYWADEATKYGTDYFNEGKYFKSYGMARMNLAFGSRNQVNTSLNLFKFAADSPTRVTVNFDAGRPFELNPETLQLKTPIGWNKDWRQEMPLVLENTFQLTQTSAHPSFDPYTQEFFTVCFKKGLATLIFSKEFNDLLEKFENLIKDEVEWLEKALSSVKMAAEKFVRLIEEFVKHLFGKAQGEHDHAFDLEKAVADLDREKHSILDEFHMEDNVWLMRWKDDGAIESWRLLDADTGEHLVINQTMHQTNFSKDYIVLVDSSLKFALDILENEPFPGFPWLSRALRRLTSKTIEPNTPLYIIDRRDLIPGAPTANAKQFMVDLETVHFYVDYENPNDQITIHTAHNCTVCAAEWVRSYDTLAIDPERPALPNTLGLIACGEMDIGRIGKFIVDAKNAVVVKKTIIKEMGFETKEQFDNHEIKAHTWSVGLTTYRDYVSAEKVNAQLRQLYWQSYGLDYRMLTNFIKELYSDYEHRAIPVDDMMYYTKGGVPFALLRQNTVTMTLDDYYLFKMNQNMRSLQFVPRQRPAGEEPPHDIQMDGYILCTMINGPEDLEGPDEYTREIWLFDAADLKKGPVCKLHHPALNYSFTIHSTWAPDCKNAETNYHIDIRKDYDEVIAQFWDESHRNWMQEFMNKNVYPHYENQ
jgi:hypothetical protein